MQHSMPHLWGCRSMQILGGRQARVLGVCLLILMLNKMSVYKLNWCCYGTMSMTTLKSECSCQEIAYGFFRAFVGPAGSVINEP